MSITRSSGDKKDSTLHAAQAPGIYLSLLAKKPVGDILGTDQDIEILLKSLTVPMPEYMRFGQKNVLATVDSVNPDLDGNDQLLGLIKPFYTSVFCAGKDYELEIPCYSGGHFQVATLTVKAGVITGASLYDPTATTELTETATYRNLKKVVDELKGDTSIPVRPIAAGVQTNGHSCMDYCVQKIVSDVGTTDPTLQAIVAAPSANALRDAIVAKIKKEKFFAINVENLHKYLISAEAGVATQQNFDAEMAKELAKLYDAHPSLNDDALFEQARNTVCNNLLSSVGFFATVKNKPKREDLILPEPGITPAI